MTKYALLVLMMLPLTGVAQSVERWGLYEVSLQGPAERNPYLEHRVGAEFRLKHRMVKVDGFYDGGGAYKVRFMPDEVGQWTYTTTSDVAELRGRSGQFTVVAGRSHGPVEVANTYHFAYADGTPYYPVGTTSYAWVHQSEELEQQTLKTLRTAGFNKMRMCVFPKHYDWNHNEPRYYPFPRTAEGVNDFTRFEPAFWRHLEQRVRELGEMGIEADLILFHPYDRWGYQNMPAEVDDRYLKYAIARLGAFRNVWWSLANEYDFMKAKKMADWDRFGRIVAQEDPYSHLRSIHHSGPMYDPSKAWVTHLSVQSSDMEKAGAWMTEYKKPVIYDECKYEGNVPRRWGNISAQELVRRLWVATAQGAYAGHGETYLDPNDVLWWAKGGVLKGESAPRFAFLRKLLEESGTGGLMPVDRYYLMAGKAGEYYLCYFDEAQPGEYTFKLPAGVKYRAEVIDPWAMTATALEGEHEGTFTLKLPSKPGLAVRLKKAR